MVYNGHVRKVNTMTKFYLVRHGQTVFNVKGRIQGWCDSPLTELGIQQAKELGENLKVFPFDICFCSTSERAIDTAHYILENRNIEIVPTKQLKEQCFGDFEAEKVEDVFKNGVQYPDGYRFCGGENFSDVIDRFFNELKKIALQYPDANILIVSHGSAIKHIVNSLCSGFINEKIRTADLVPNCSLTRIDYDKKFFLIEKPHSFHDQ